MDIVDPAADAAPADAVGTCSVDGECPSGMCEAGACVAADLIAYVAVDGLDANPCTPDRPCATVAHALAVVAIQDPRRVVIEAGRYAQALVLGAGTAIIVGRGDDGGRPTLAPSSGDAVLLSGGRLTVRHLAIDGGGGGNGDGFRCTNGALVVEDVQVSDVRDDGFDVRDCATTLIRTTVAGSGTFGVRAQRQALVVRSSTFVGNADGGLRASPVDTLTITGSLFARNGRPSVGLNTGSPVGGAELRADGALLFDSNTVADNDAASDNDRAISCADSNTGMLPNNLLTSARQFSTTCPLTYSMTTGLVWPSGTNRTIVQPGYVDPDALDYHITTGSEAHGAGTAPTAMAAPDLDGQPRPQAELDVGADEIE